MGHFCKSSAPVDLYKLQFLQSDSLKFYKQQRTDFAFCLAEVRFEWTRTIMRECEVF